MGHFLYRRHFTVLIAIVGVLVVTVRWRPSLGIYPTFAVYGALHALALVVSLRGHESRVRRILFIGAAAALSAASVFLGVEAIHHVRPLPAMVHAMLVLGLASGFGAVCYAVLIRRFWTLSLSNRAALAMACGCVITTEFVLVSGLLPRTDGLWFAAPWWFTFSMMLGYQDGRTPHRS